ncbi:hypothetical protein [Frankia sp. AvcI1]|uniref:hypothetical protein n=1 Tax=Frankia sp. AvcI1 TaxID=573496 RepID=UPI0021172C4A|nr:hypothetical protein [Frankia sp. AvcI1]
MNRVLYPARAVLPDGRTIHPAKVVVTDASTVAVYGVHGGTPYAAFRGGIAEVRVDNLDTPQLPSDRRHLEVAVEAGGILTVHQTGHCSSCGPLGRLIPHELQP